MTKKLTNQEMDSALRRYRNASAPTQERFQQVEAYVHRAVTNRFGQDIWTKPLQPQMAHSDVHNALNADWGILNTLRTIFMRPAFGLVAVAALALGVAVFGGRIASDATLADRSLEPKTSSAVAVRGGAETAPGISPLPKSIFAGAVASITAPKITQKIARPAVKTKRTAPALPRAKSVFSDEEMATYYRRGKNLFIDEERDRVRKNRSVFSG